LVGFDVAELAGDDPSLAIVLPRSLETHIPRELSARKSPMQCVLRNIKKFAFLETGIAPRVCIVGDSLHACTKKGSLPAVRNHCALTRAIPAPAITAVTEV
jgi:hypothetical protein